jgi:hypothetical protein
MKERVFAKNPSELHIIENPNQRRSNMAKKSKITTEKAVSEFKQQAITAGYILGGQAVAAQVNALAVPILTGNSSATIQQATRAGIPLTAGVLLNAHEQEQAYPWPCNGYGRSGRDGNHQIHHA